MNCSFCNQTIQKGTGKTVITANGKITNYCKSKCEKNAKIGRDPRKVRWVKKK